ncbi:MAG: hypothetical protein MK102_19725, partial [Fuerstiella sp.]|nr:hypothetical protein [Fuerstiella sp.]
MKQSDDGRYSVDRRSFIQTSAAALGFGMVPFAGADTITPRVRKRIAAVVTIYIKNSHTDVLIGKILEGWNQAGGPGPDLELASMYVDQFPDREMARDISREMSVKHGFPICDSIEQAISLGEGQVAVDGIISVGEHGEYPWNEK